MHLPRRFSLSGRTSLSAGGGGQRVWGRKSVDNRVTRPSELKSGQKPTSPRPSAKSLRCSCPLPMLEWRRPSGGRVAARPGTSHLVHHACSARGRGGLFVRMARSPSRRSIPELSQPACVGQFRLIPAPCHRNTRGFEPGCREKIAPARCPGFALARSEPSNADPPSGSYAGGTANQVGR